MDAIPGSVVITLLIVMAVAILARLVAVPSDYSGQGEVQLEDPQQDDGDLRTPGTALPQPHPSGTPGPDPEWRRRLYMAEAAVQAQARVALPEDLEALPEFGALVGVLAEPQVDPEVLLGYWLSDNVLLSWASLVVLAARPRDPVIEDRLLAKINFLHPWTRSFMLRAFEAWNPDDPALTGRVLVKLDATWASAEFGIVLEEFLRRRAAIGPATLSEETAAEINGTLIGRILKFVDPAVAGPLFDQLKVAERDVLEEAPAGRPEPPTPSGAMEEMLGPDELHEIGRVIRPGKFKATGLIATPSGDAWIETVVASIAGGTRRSVLVVGEAGVGKTTLLRRAAARLSAEGWTLFEAGAAQLNAGALFIGALEHRLGAVRRQLGRGRKIVWLCPDFHQLLWSGRHISSPTGVLEMLMPAFESGDIVLMGETRTAALDRVLAERPEVARLFEILRIEPTPESELVALLDTWSDDVERERRVRVPRETRREAIALARQYLSAQAPPGGVLRLLDGALARAAPRVTADAAATLGMDDLIEALAQLTGLPLDVLDDRRPLDLEAVRLRFESRVIGQQDAVRCLVDRLALLKAGVTDPARPTGVFLFAGGSGTGKTEMAKTLADYLFGSSDRLVRIDMSELQDAHALDRLVGAAGVPGAVAGTAGGSLAERVRRQPFSVVLLDEFEKAHPRVWDVFLQVFDDGRLTDHRGETTDFRHAIIILTSNLGTAGDGSTRLGLTGEEAGFSPGGVRRAVERTFKPEFLNRLDDVLVFRPLTRNIMRRILRKELTEAFARRGLRRRDWAIELEESAMDLLIQRGFSPTFGARPLRRTLERLLLTPLAAAIVDRRAPEGGQFLFVRADGDGLAVAFVDPDAEDTAPTAIMAAGVAAALAAPEDGRAIAARDLAAIVFEPHGSPDEIELLRECLTALRDIVEADGWHEAKQALLLEMSAPGFWEREDRFDRMGRAEYMDRIESGIRSASSLLARLEHPSALSRIGYPRAMVGRLAQQLHLLCAAHAEALDTGPRDAFVMVEPLHEDPSAPGAAREFAERLTAMYESWARARGMRLAVLPPRTDCRDGCPMLAVSGFGAYALLEAEDGLHVFEGDDHGDRQVRRATARVRIALQPARPAHGGEAGLARQATETLAAHTASTSVVRRYREKPSPLVRDAVRGWRTGRIERVLGGDFDVIPSRDG